MLHGQPDRPEAPLRFYLKDWRQAKGLTQEQLGERMDTPKGQISKLERGGQKWNAEWVARAASALGVEEGDLFRHPDQPTADELLRGASPKKRAQALAVIEALLKAG